MIDEDLKQLIEGTAAETRRQFDALAGGLRQVDAKVDAAGDGLRAQVNGLRTEVADYRHQSRIEAESVEHKIQLVAETVLALGERMDRRFVDLDSRMADEFAETRAMIRLGDADLDRRLRSLEERVERLESNTPH